MSETNQLESDPAGPDRENPSGEGDPGAKKDNGVRHRKKKALNLVIRPMEIDDLAAVFHLGEKLFRASVVPNLYRTWDEYEVVAFFMEDPEFCLVAEAEDRIVGFALGTTIRKSYSSWKYGHLTWMGVDPAVQQQGAGEKMFLRFRDMMKKNGVQILVVDSEADNLPALRFFRKMGFGHPEEHIYLSLNLAPRKHESGERHGNSARSQAEP